MMSPRSRLLSRALCVSLAWSLAVSAHGTNLGLIVTEEGKASLSYTFEPTTFKFREVAFDRAEAVAQTQGYEARDGQLLKQGAPLPNVLGVGEVLYQCQIDGVDLVVVRTWKNSMSSPMKVLSAMSGHPIQKSSVLALRIEGAKVLARRELIGRDSSYHWRARIVRLDGAQDKP